MRCLGWSIVLSVCLLGGCGGSSPFVGGSGSSSSSSSSGAAVTNSVAMTVGPGPDGQTNINIPYVTVTICQPGTSKCVTVKDMLVDTGSYGIRVLASVLAAGGVTLGATTDPANPQNTIAECIPFVDGYTWGPMTTATVMIGGETAASIPVNVLNDNGNYTPPVPTACTADTINTSLNSVQSVQANGVLGIGVFADDCGQTCGTCASAGGGCTDSNTSYYSCNEASNACTPTQVAETAQTRNPVIAFATDNNGVILELPQIPATGSPSVTGTLVFGIGTQSNNALGSARVLTVNGNGFFTTTFNSSTLNNSFIDSGSNAYYFASSLPTCASNAQFYCPTSTTTLTATNQGGNGVTSMVQLQIADLNNLASTNFAFDDVGGTAATSAGTDTLNNDFDFGLPFFFGRNVFFAIDGALAAGTAGPYYAY
jgi:Protein of unknown function (DUF3443)